MVSRAMLPLLLLSLSCQADTTPPPPVALPVQPTYAARRAALEERRQALGARWAQGDTSARDAAEAVVLETIVDDLIPAWLGTPWEFYGASTTPGEGSIACGYFVSTVLEHAGFGVERIAMAQQPSERIIQTLTPESAIWRFSLRPLSDVLDRLAQEGDGLYVVGLDFHTGFLVQRSGQTTFCHASYLDEVAVVCEPAEDAAALASEYRVVGRMLEPAMLEAWLLGEPLPTRTQ